MFDIDQFVSDCVAARRQPDYVATIGALLNQAVNDRAGITAAFQDMQDEEALIYNDASLTVVHVRLSPNTAFPPHNHHMEALIGLYEGEERHRRYLPAGDKLTAEAEFSVTTGNVAICAVPEIHAVANRCAARSAALHVYCGDLVHMPRNIWHPETFEVVGYSDDYYFEWSHAYDPAKPFTRPAVCRAHAG